MQIVPIVQRMQNEEMINGMKIVSLETGKDGGQQFREIFIKCNPKIEKDE